MTALNGNLDPAVRVLDLDAERISIPVGRASKTVSKGLQGTRDNAWFDSPVMSRDHAELMLDVETDVSRTPSPIYYNLADQVSRA